MNKALFFMNLKSRYKIWIVFAVIMAFYKLTIITMYDPDDIAAIDELMRMFPDELLQAISFVIFDATLTGFIGGYYYGFIIILFPMIFTIILSFGLVGKYVDDGSMAYLLATPHKRKRIITTQAVFLLAAIFTLLSFNALFGIIVMSAMFPGELDIGKYLLLNLGAFILFFAVSGITFFFSSAFSESRQSLGFAIAVPVGFFVLDMLAGVGDTFEFLRFFTIFTLYDNAKLFPLENIVRLHYLILVMIGTLFYLAGIVVFSKKSLTL